MRRSLTAKDMTEPPLTRIYQMALEEGWNNKPLKELYPTQAHKNHPTKWLEMLVNVLRMIRDVNGAPLSAVIRKRLIPPTVKTCPLACDTQNISLMMTR